MIEKFFELLATKWTCHYLKPAPSKQSSCFPCQFIPSCSYLNPPRNCYFHAIFGVNFSLMSVCAAPTRSHQSFVGSSFYVDVETIELFPLPIYPYLLLFQFPPRNVRIIVDLFPLPMYPCSSQFPLETFES
jgi:hypothetical protein